MTHDSTAMLHRWHMPRPRWAVSVLAAMLGVLVLYGGALAQGTITVSTTDDEYDSGILCSLREAVESANQDADFGGCLRVGPLTEPLNPTPPYTIVLGAGVYELTLAGRDENNNATGDLDIQTILMIEGIGTETTFVQAGPDAESGIDRIFDITASDAQVEIQSLTLRYGLAQDGQGGGAIQNMTGQLTLTDVVLTENTADLPAANQGGGAIYNGLGASLSISDTVLSSNRASGEAASGGAILNAGGMLAVMNSTIEANESMRAGGGIEDNGTDGATTTMLDNVTLANNMTGPTPGNGGGYHLTAAGMVTVTGGMVISNTATEGGGLWNSGAGMMTILRTAIHGNEANGEGENRGGGGVFNVGGALDIANTTISGNRAVSAGGGVMAIGGEETSLTNVTIYANAAENGAGGIQTRNDASITLANSIVAADTAAEMPGADCAGMIEIPAGVPNLDRDGTCGASITADPMLGMLQDNSGNTLTHALLMDSPALNAGDNTICAAAPVNNVDQRGVVRPQLGQCDLGAYEDVVEVLRQLLMPFLLRDE